MDEILDDLGLPAQTSRGRDGRIYAKQVDGRRKWDPWWSPIKWPVEALQRSTWDKPAVLAVREGESDDSGEPWSLGKAGPSPPAEGRERHDSGVQRRVGTVGWRGGRCAGVYVPRYPAPFRQPAQPDSQQTDPHT